jgi:hypothetical protein
MVSTADFGEEGSPAAHASGVDLDHLPTSGPPKDVEVVDVAVAEDATRCGDVAGMRWLLVCRGEVHPPELT